MSAVTGIIKIYALKDPLTHKVEYVGKTGDNLKLRLDQHICKAKQADAKGPRDKWIRTLLAQNMRPVIDIIETVTGDWQERERYWIAYYKNSMGHKLKNGTLGGLGVQTKAPHARQYRKPRLAAGEPRSGR